MCWIAGSTGGGTAQNGGYPTRGTVGATDGTVTWIDVSGHPALNGDQNNTPVWTASSNAFPGAIIKDVAGTHLFLTANVTTSQSGTVEPTWNVASLGATTTDNQITWKYIGTPASFPAWSAPYAVANLAANVTPLPSPPAGANAIPYVTLCFGDDHVETATVQVYSILPNANLCQMISIDHTNISNAKPGSIISSAAVSANVVISSTANAWVYASGITINSTSNIFAANIAFDSCSLKIGLSGGFYAGNTTLTSNNNQAVALSNTTIYSSGSQSFIFVPCGKFTWKNTPSAVNMTANSLFGNGTASSFPSTTIVLEGVDLTGFTSTTALINATSFNSASFLFTDCKLNSTTVINNPTQEFVSIDLLNSDPTTLNTFQHLTYTGTLKGDQVVTRTNGAATGSTPVSYKISTTATPSWIEPFECFPITIWNSQTNTNRVVTIYGIVNDATVPKNDHVWMDIEYKGSSTTGMGSYATSGRSGVVSSNVAYSADTSSWSATVPARVNGATYVAGATIMTSNNAGRVFFCTTGGVASGSEPAGYTSAVDGGSVTDGTAVFRAGCRFSMVTTLSSPQPQMAGLIKATVKAARPSMTYYIDPLINLG